MNYQSFLQLLVGGAVDSLAEIALLRIYIRSLNGQTRRER
jgi:hypothetical protein